MSLGWRRDHNFFTNGCCNRNLFLSLSALINNANINILPRLCFCCFFGLNFDEYLSVSVQANPLRYIVTFNGFAPGKQECLCLSSNRSQRSYLNSVAFLFQIIIRQFFNPQLAGGGGGVKRPTFPTSCNSVCTPVHNFAHVSQIEWTIFCSIREKSIGFL